MSEMERFPYGVFFSPSQRSRAMNIKKNYGFASAIECSSGVLPYPDCSDYLLSVIGGSFKLFYKSYFVDSARFLYCVVKATHLNISILLHCTSRLQ